MRRKTMFFLFGFWLLLFCRHLCLRIRNRPSRLSTLRSDRRWNQYSWRGIVRKLMKNLEVSKTIPIFASKRTS